MWHKDAHAVSIFKVTFFDDRRPQERQPTEFGVEADSPQGAIEKATILFHQKCRDEDIDNYESHCSFLR